MVQVRQGLSSALGSMGHGCAVSALTVYVMRRTEVHQCLILLVTVCMHSVAC